MHYCLYFIILAALGSLLLVSNNKSLNKILSVVATILILPALAFGLGLIKLSGSLNLLYGLAAINFKSILTAISRSTEAAFVTAMSIAFFITLIYYQINKFPKNFNYKDMGLGLIYAGVSFTALTAERLHDLLIFLETAPLWAVFLIARNSGKEGSKSAALHYLLVYMLNAGLLSVGIDYVIHIRGVHTVSNLNNLALAIPFSVKYLILAAMLISLAVFPFFGWLLLGLTTCAGRVAVLLSIFILWSNVLVIDKLFLGMHSLVYFGGALCIEGVIYGFFSQKFKGKLTFNLITQVGFCLIWFGVSGQAFNHSFSEFNLIIVTLVLINTAFFILSDLLNSHFKHDNLYYMQGFLRKQPALLALVLVISVISFSALVSLGVLIINRLETNVLSIYDNWLFYVVILAVAGSATGGINFKLWYILSFKKHQKETSIIYKLPWANNLYYNCLFIILPLTIFSVVIGVYWGPQAFNLGNLPLIVLILGACLLAITLGSFYKQLKAEPKFYTAINSFFISIFKWLKHLNKRLFKLNNSVATKAKKIAVKLGKYILILNKIYYNSLLILIVLITLAFFSILLFLV